MLTTISKRIQSRLARQGVKVALGDIKEQCDLKITDINNVTDEEVLAVTQFFIDNATQLTVITEDVEAAFQAETLSTSSSGESTAQSSAIAPTAKSELVSRTAQNMGIVLDTSEISLIAENINDSTDTLEQDINAIKAAIMAFVEHKAIVSQQKISSMINEVRQVVGEKNHQNSQLLSDGLRNINNDIQEANKQFKSNVSKAISAFAIPSIKAG